MFIRFVIHSNDIDSGRRQGLFQALRELETQGLLSEHEVENYYELRDWFRKNLRKPVSFTRSSKPHAKKVALSWFKDTATQHISTSAHQHISTSAHQHDARDGSGTGSARCDG